VPLILDELMTANGGQVSGLGRAAVQSILADYDIPHVLAAEGGRTSQGTTRIARRYAAFLNANAGMDLEDAERWWVGRVSRADLRARPLKFRYDHNKSIRFLFRDLFLRAEEQGAKKSNGPYAVKVHHYVVGATLTISCPLLNIPAYEAIEPTVDAGYGGGFRVGSSAIHCAISPGEEVLGRCSASVRRGLRPIIFTYGRGLTLAHYFAEQAGIANRLEVAETDQFIAASLHQVSGFDTAAARDRVSDLLSTYNTAVANCEEDDSLRIELISRSA
jgi:hypothetical protein